MPDPLPPPSALLFLRREVCEHLLHSLVEILGVLIRIVGKGIAGRTSPQQILVLGIEQIDDQRTHAVGFSRRGCISEPAKSSPAPTATKAIVKGVESLLLLRNLDRHDTDIATRIDLGPTFSCQGPIHRILN